MQPVCPVEAELNKKKKPFRVLTGWLIGSQVFEVEAFDDLHGEASRGGVVHQPHEDLRGGGLADGLERRGAFAAGHIRQAALVALGARVLHADRKSAKHQLMAAVLGKRSGERFTLRMLAFNVFKAAFRSNCVYFTTARPLSNKAAAI